jgi:hypothetical protein
LAVLEGWGDARGATVLRRCIEELASEVQADASQTATPKEAQLISGYTPDYLRSLASEGVIANVGTESRHRYRISDLPIKARSKRSVAATDPTDDNSNEVFRDIVASKYGSL